MPATAMPATRRFAAFATICAFLFAATATAKAAADTTGTTAIRATPACSTCWVATP